MTLAASTRYKQYHPTVSTTSFLVTFPIFDNDEIEVYVDGLLTTDFSVVATYADGEGRSTDATVVLETAALDVDVEIYGSRTPKTDENFSGSQPNLAEIAQLSIDKVTATQQEQARDLSRSVRVLGGEALAAVERADDTVFGFNEDGELTLFSRTTLEPVTSTSVGNPNVWTLSPAADGATDDTAKFTSLETAYSRGKVDLRGATFLVSAVPTGLAYRNGGFLVQNVLGAGDVSVVYPAGDTLDRRIVGVSRGDFVFESFAQGKRHIATLSGNTVHYCAFNAGDLFDNGGSFPVVFSSDDDGNTWKPDCVIFSESTYDANCWALAEYAGQQVALVRTVNASTDVNTDTRMFGRRLYERRVDQTINLDTTNASGSFSINVATATAWGVKVGDVVALNGFGTHNNLDLDDIDLRFTVTAVTNSAITLLHPTDTADTTEADAELTDGTIVFNPDGAGFAEMFFDTTDSILDEVLAYPGSPFSSNPTTFNGLVLWAGDGTGEMKTSAYGGGATGPRMIQVDSFLLEDRNIQRIDTVGAITEGTEVSACLVNGVDWYGGVRGSTGVEAKLWFKAGANDTSDATVWDFTAGFGLDSPVCVEVDETNSIVYVVMTDTRYRDETAGSVPLLLGWCSTTAFQASGTAAFTFWKVADLHFSKSNTNSAANGVGLPSTALADGVLHIAYSSEHGPEHRDDDGRPRVYDMAVAIGPDGPVAQVLPQRALRPAKARDNEIWLPDTGSVSEIGDNAPVIKTGCEMSYRHQLPLKIPNGNFPIKQTISPVVGEYDVIGTGTPFPHTRGVQRGSNLISHEDLGSDPMWRLDNACYLERIGFAGRGKGTGAGVLSYRLNPGETTHEDADNKLFSCHFSEFDDAVIHRGRGMLLFDCAWQLNSVDFNCNWIDDADFVDVGSQNYDDKYFGFRAIRIVGGRSHSSTTFMQNVNDGDSTDADKLRCLISGIQLDGTDCLFDGYGFAVRFVGVPMDNFATNTGAIRLRGVNQYVGMVGCHLVGQPANYGEWVDLSETVLDNFPQTAANGTPIDGSLSTGLTASRHLFRFETINNLEIAASILANSGQSGYGHAIYGNVLKGGKVQASLNQVGDGSTSYGIVSVQTVSDTSFEIAAKPNSGSALFHGRSGTWTRTTIENTRAPEGTTHYVGITDGGGNRFCGERLTDPEVTIASGAITVTADEHSVDTESDAASDDLDTINDSFPAGTDIYLRAEAGTRTVVLKHGTGNIYTLAETDISLTNVNKMVHLRKISNGNWLVI